MDIYSYEKTKYQSIFSSPQKQSQSKGLVSELELVRSKTDRWHTPRSDSVKDYEFMTLYTRRSLRPVTPRPALPP